MNASKMLIAAAVVGLSVAGCGGSNTVPANGGAVPDNGLNGFGSESNRDTNLTPIDPASTTPFEVALNRMNLTAAEDDMLRNNLIVYFEFDSADVRSDFNAMLALHGRFLSENPDFPVRLEGHADERGSREYNIGLGERRAQAVRQILQLQGARGAQLTTVSYGEERPQAFGSDEESYGLNRRVELVYQ